jgi:hypothetical protein
VARKFFRNTPTTAVQRLPQLTRVEKCEVAESCSQRISFVIALANTYGECLSARIYSRITVHQDADRDAPLVFVQLFHAHHITDLLAMHRIVRTEVQ